MLGSQIIVKALQDEGVRFLFGIPGTHNIELYDALADAEELIPVLVTDEQSASFMADGVARASGEMACINLVPSAGLTHAMSGIAECYLDQIPLLILSSGIRRDSGKSYQLHHVEQGEIAKPVCKKVFIPRTHAEIYPTLREACALAREAPPGPVMVEIPAELYLFSGEGDSPKVNFEFLPKNQTTIPSQNNLDSIVSTLNSSQSIAIYAGLGAVEANEGLIKLAEKLSAIVFTTISGKGVFPENHPRWGWMTMGNAAPPEIRDIEKSFDCLLAVGCRFAEVATGSYGFSPPTNLIHIDADPQVFNKNYQAKFTWTSQAVPALQALLDSPLLKSHPPSSDKLSRLANSHQKIKAQQREKPVQDEKVTPFRLIDNLQEIFGPDAIFVTDSGNGTFMAMELLRLPKPRSFLGPIDYSCMGYSVPAAVGAKMACPDRPVVGLHGDGAFLMTGMELLTAASNRIGIVSCILRDGALSQIAQFQKTSFNRTILTTLPSFGFESFARAVQVEYLAISNDHQIKDQLNKARELSQTGKPVLVEVAIDYSEKTYFTKGVVKTNFLRFPWKDRFRLVGRVIKRKIL